METFIVRIWSGDGGGGGAEGVRGVVRHVASGREEHFTGFEDLRAFLSGKDVEAADPHRQPSAGGVDTLPP